MGHHNAEQAPDRPSVMANPESNCVVQYCLCVSLTRFLTWLEDWTINQDWRQDDVEMFAERFAQNLHQVVHQPSY